MLEFDADSILFICLLSQSRKDGGSLWDVLFPFYIFLTIEVFLYGKITQG